MLAARHRNVRREITEMSDLKTTLEIELEDLRVQREQCLTGVTRQGLIDKISAEFDSRIAVIERRLAEI